ncbi:unnamed protein product [Auanema sp. JU1783]|nr:unnamed protein product [Auanema sp. JU1783]
MKIKKSSKVVAKPIKKSAKKADAHPKQKKITEKKVKADSKPEEKIENDSGNEDSADEMETGKNHLSGLKKIQAQDPDFFKFLQEEDPDLLEFEESDIENEEEEEDEDEEEEEEEEEEGKLKRPKAKKDSTQRLIFDGNQFSYLQSIFDPEDESKKIKPSTQDLKLALDAFLACISRVGADMDVPKYVINEQPLFDATIRLIFQSLGDFFLCSLTKASSGIEEGGKAEIVPVSMKNINFKKYREYLKVYLDGLIMFLNEVQSDAVIISTLKAILKCLSLFPLFKKLSRNLVKVVERVWSRKPIECRVVAYFCLAKLCKISPDSYTHIYKSCYLGFVSNSREVSMDTWPLLQFMHRTFSEITLINPEAAYPYAFVYIRQTAIHLRNALISKKRTDMMQTVYNWQLIQCLFLWVRVVSKAHEMNGAESICELVYPLTQIIIGVSKLYISRRFLPLRFHCVTMLIQLQANCTTYIPTFELAAEIMPLIEILLRKKPKVSKVKVQYKDLSCLLKVSQQQFDDPIVRSDICQTHFRLMLQSAHLLCNQPSFADLAQPIVNQMKVFLKNIRCADSRRLYKGLLEKVEAHSKFVTNAVAAVDIELKDEMNVRALKLKLNTPESPLRVYYRQWEKIWKLKQTSQTQTKTVEKEAEKENRSSEKEKTAKPKKRKVKIAPAASKADATIPDALETLSSWSDDE